MAETINLGIVGIKNMGEYDSETEYEKLNVVTYQGSSYCALRDTVGNLPTDTDYWQLYAQKGDKGENSDLNELAIVGDSYTASYGSDWAEKLASQLNLTLHKSASGGSGWIRTSVQTHFIDLLNNFNTPGSSVYMTENERNRTKYFITYGGINDANDVHNNGETALITAMDTYIETAKTLFPNAQILIVGPQMMSTEAENVKYPECQIAMSKACLKNGVAYADARYWLLDSNYTYTQTYRDDYLHPSTLGLNIITSKMLGLINNSIASTNTIKFTFGTGFTGNVAYRETNELIVMNFALNGTFAAGTDIVIGTFVSSLKDFISAMAYPVYKANNYDYINGLFGGVKVASGNTLYLLNTTGTEYTGRIKFTIIIPKVPTKITIS